MAGVRPKVVLVDSHDGQSSQNATLRAAATQIVSAQIDVVASSAPRTAARQSLLEMAVAKRRFFTAMLPVLRASLRRDVDLVIAFHPLSGIMAAALTRFGPHDRRPPIVALTLTIRPQSRGVEAIRRSLYRFAFSNPRLRLATQSEVARRAVLERFPSAEVQIVRELLVDPPLPARPDTAGGEGIVAAGYSGRNWAYLREVAAHTSLEVRVMTTEDQWGDSTPSNVKATFDDDKEGFDAVLRDADLLILPLIANEAAGFLVAVGAAQAGIPVLWSSPSCLDEYAPDGYPTLPLSDPAGAARIIEGFMNDADQRAELPLRLKASWDELLDPAAILAEVVARFSA